MLQHSNIKIFLDSKYLKGMEIEYDHSFLCTPIDEFFGYCYGKLPYRSILFEEKKSKESNLSAAVVNFTDNSIYTRKTQWNLLPNSGKPISNYNTLTYEIPCSMKENPGEYYYPVHTNESRKKYEKYRKLSLQKEKITFCGRTGLFRYIDMIPAVMIHLKIAKDFLKIKKL